MVCSLIPRIIGYGYSWYFRVVQQKRGQLLRGLWEGHCCGSFLLPGHLIFEFQCFNKQGLTLFQEPTIFQFQRSLRMTAIDFISQIGGNTVLLLALTTQYCPPIGLHHLILASDWLVCPGLLGLFLGFSLISGFELLYWFTLRLGQRLCCQPRHTWAAPCFITLQLSGSSCNSHVHGFTKIFSAVWSGNTLTHQPLPILRTVRPSKDISNKYSNSR